MAYSADISALGADHHWKFDGDSIDAIGAVVRTDTGMTFASSPIAEDATFSALFNTRTGDRISIATTTTINNAAHARKAVCGWFMVDAVELPHCRIYGEGTTGTNFQIILFAGNSVMVELRSSTTWQVQVYSDIALVASRAYHLCVILEGSGYSDEIRFYIDGVEQTTGDPTSRAPGSTTLATRGVAEFGDPAGTVGLNGVNLVMNSVGDNVAANQIINGYYQHWAAWGDEADAVLTVTEVRETLFERGALAEDTIATGTEVAMQSALDAAVADETQVNAPLNIEVNAVTGGGDFSLDLDNVTFDALASCHVRYNGTADTLTIVNTNGSNCTIVSAPFGGAIELRTQLTVKVTVKDASDLSVVSGARVLLEADTGGPLSAGTDILDGTTNGSGVIEDTTFLYGSDQPVTGKVRKGTATPFYAQANISSTITNAGLDITVLMVPDE